MGGPICFFGPPVGCSVHLAHIEIAPGVDLKKDVLALMEFEPQISDDLKLMDPRLFRPEPMGVSLKKK